MIIYPKLKNRASNNTIGLIQQHMILVRMIIFGNSNFKHQHIFNNHFPSSKVLYFLYFLCSINPQENERVFIDK